MIAVRLKARINIFNSVNMLLKKTNFGRRLSASVRLPSVSSDYTHHIWSPGEPAYEKRFKSVLSYHPNVNAAAVEDVTGSYHIGLNGEPLYAQRFSRTYGYYENLAAVCLDAKSSFHISVDGSRVYNEKYAWCGNFTRLPNAKAQAPVRRVDGSYVLIDECGKVRSGPYKYVGDSNSQGQVVAWKLDGACQIVNTCDGSIWGSGGKSGTPKFDTRLPHKGIASVKDDRGWTFVDCSGSQVGTGRYLEVEPHYNGQARVRLLTGAWAVVDEAGAVLVELGQFAEEAQHDLVSAAQKYWQSAALKMVLSCNVINTVETGSTLDPKLKEVLLNVACDMGLCTRGSVTTTSGAIGVEFRVTEKGRLLGDTATRDKCEYWLQDRYFKAWFPLLAQFVPAAAIEAASKMPDTFRDLSSDKPGLALSQRVLAAYAKQDWHGVSSLLPLESLLGRQAPATVVDLAGGTGSLLREIEQSGVVAGKLSLVCVERPEVVDLARAAVVSESSVQFVSGDLFSGSLPSGDLYLLSRVLHDWDDRRALQVLTRVHQQSPADATLCVIDRHASPDNMHSMLSLHMYMLQRSFERTAEQWESLFSHSSWQTVGQKPFAGHVVVMLKKREGSVGGENASTEPEVGTIAGASTTLAPRSGPRKAVVPIAGLGTRMGVQSLVTPKALLPVFGRDKSMQPALGLLLDQLLAEGTGIEQVCIVASPSQLTVLSAYLRAFELTRESGASTPDALHAGSSLDSGRLSYLRDKISVVVQPTALGFGDAILAAKRFVGGEPFTVALGDHVFSPGCVQQVVRAYRTLLSKSGNLSEDAAKRVGLTGACLCNRREIPLTGLLQLATHDINASAAEQAPVATLVVDMAEKPQQFDRFETAPASGKYMSQLGIDIVPAGIFPELERLKEVQSLAGGEVDLRAAIKEVLQAKGDLYSCLVEGTRMDIGTPAAYWSSLQSIIRQPVQHYATAAKKSLQAQDRIVTGALLSWLRGLPELANLPASTAETHIASAPGRIDLMGGFADYSGSSVLQYPTATRCYALVSLTDSQAIELVSARVASVDEILNAHSAPDANSAGAVLPQQLLSKVFPLDVLSSDTNAALTQLASKEILRARLESSMSGKQDLWPSYIIGVLHALLEEAAQSGSAQVPRGIRVMVVSDVPWNTSLASSASVEMSTAFAFGHALGMPAGQLDRTRIALVCQEVENRVVGANCGFMDHVAVAHAPLHGASSSLLGLRCRLPLPSPPTQSVLLPDGMSVVAVESGVIRSVSDPPYKQVRIASQMGRHIINSATAANAPLSADNVSRVLQLCDVSLSTYKLYFQDALPVAMTGREFLSRYGNTRYPAADELNASDIGLDTVYPVQASTAHPIEEHARVGLFESILSGMSAHNGAQAAEQLGELMHQSHASYTKCGLGTAETDLLADLLRGHSAPSATGPVVGAKISGGGGGGAIAVLLQESNSGAALQLNSPIWSSISSTYKKETGLTCTLRDGVSGRMRYHGTATRSFSSGCGSSCGETTATAVKPRGKLRVLMVNHGYPPMFNGGSEVYAQTLALQLLGSGECSEINVMAREHDPFRPDFEIRRTVDDANPLLPVHLVNYPREAPYYAPISSHIDEAFRQLVRQLQPDVVHFHHFNHLSLNLPAIAKEECSAKVVYTLHDYWLMCPRGQFLVTGVTTPERPEPWQQCGGQEDRKCATDCYTNRYSTGCSADKQTELDYWMQWIGKRMGAVRTTCDQIDAFVAPSKYLQRKFIQDFKLPEYKVIQQPYGFDRPRMAGRQRVDSGPDAPYVFAYIGRHQPSKGINLLVQAALSVIEENPAMANKFVVKIYGRVDINSTVALQRMMDEALPNGRAAKVFQWHKEYNNFNIVGEVFDHVDAIVVPSIWEENSPLVIHEAQQCGVPVITANHGGMGELVADGVNGRTFDYRSASSLAAVMRQTIDRPAAMQELGKRGYLNSDDGGIPCVKEHAQGILQLYNRLLQEPEEGVAERPTAVPSTQEPEVKVSRSSPSTGGITPLAAPWRITFDTNPDDCNFSCTMCEQHSEHSPHQKARKANKIRRRRMDIDLIRNTVKEVASLGLREIIPTTMGEPLMYKEFPQIIDICREFNVKLNLTTNGSFFGRSVTQWANLIAPVAVDVKFSWNGATEATQQKIMKNSKLATQISNLQQFVVIRDKVAADGGNYCSVTLQLTFMEVNLEEIPAIVVLAIDNGCDRVKGHHLWAHFDEIADQNLRRSRESILRWNAVAKQCRDYANAHPLRNGKTLRLDNFFDLELSAAAAPDSGGAAMKSSSPIHPDAVCPFLGKEAWVNHEGRFDPCCAPDEQRKALGNFGNLIVPRQSLMEIWQSDKYTELCDTYLTKPLCHGCNMRQPPRHDRPTTVKTI